MTREPRNTGIRQTPELSKLWADFMRRHVTDRPPEAPVPAGKQTPAHKSPAQAASLR